MQIVTNQIAYKCELCGKMFDTEDKASKCEDSHARELDKVYMDTGISPFLYPDFITVEFDNGKLIIYKRLEKRQINAANLR